MSDITLKQAIQCMESLCGTLNDHDNECLRILLETALASQAQQPTDLSKQLREYAADSGYSHNDYADTMLAAASEIERYYGGMIAWKKTAETKDRKLSQEIENRISERCAARLVASQAQQTESKQGCKECDGQTYIHSPTGECLGECPYCTQEQEPYAYAVPTVDGTELAYAIYFTKYNNPLPEGAIPLYASQQESQLPDISTLKRIAKELKTYIPEADEYKGKFIHKVWAKEIELALPPAPEEE